MFHLLRIDESYEATLLKHGPGSTFCTASRHKNQSLPFRSTLVAPAFCSQPIHMHKNVGDACYNWAKSNYYPLTEANTLGISGPHRRWHGDRSRLRAAIGSAMEGKPIHIAVLGCSFTEGRGCAPRWFNGTKINRVTWPDRLESMLKWMFPKTSSVHVNQYNVMGGTSFNALRNLPKSFESSGGFSGSILTLQNLGNFVNLINLFKFLECWLYLLSSSKF